MKKLFTICLVLANLSALPQAKGWFFSLSTSYVINGPGLLIKNKMEDQFYNSYEDTWLWSTDYPIKGRNINIMTRAGRQVSPKFSAYMLAGLADNGSVKGYRQSGSSSQTIETHPSVNYKLYQFAAGIMFTPGRAMLGLAPSLFLLDYRFRDEENDNTTGKGFNVSLQVPLNKPGKKFGFDFLIESNYSSPLHIKRATDDANQFQPGKIKMVNGSIGIACTFRHL